MLVKQTSFPKLTETRDRRNDVVQNLSNKDTNLRLKSGKTVNNTIKILDDFKLHNVQTTRQR